MTSHEWIDSWLCNGTLIALNDGRLLLGLGERIWKTDLSQNDAYSQDDHKAHFFASDFFLKNKAPWFCHKNEKVIAKHELLQLLQPLRKTYQISRRWSNPSLKTFKEQFEDLKLKLSSEELIKAVPYMFDVANSTVSNEDKVQFLINIISYASSHPAYIYGTWEKDAGILGATPEILFRQTAEDVLETMACAGTTSKAVPIEQFMKDPKLLHEHHVVVKSLEDSLGLFGNVTKGDLKVLELPNLNHLVTKISLRYKKALPIEELIRILHPTPALGAYPVAAGAKWLQAYEKKIPRQRFGAPFGVCLNGQAEGSQVCMYVAIRNVQWEKEKMLIGAGAGIVKASLFELEFAEIQLKLKAIKEMLGL